MTDFALDPRLENDTHMLGDLPLCRVLLMDDRRWPWLILVPRVADANELHDLDEAQNTLLIGELAHVSAALKQATACLKVNTGALGNIVSQLHVHAVARNEGDPGWPGPVWGHGERQPYSPGELSDIADPVSRAILGEHAAGATNVH